MDKNDRQDGPIVKRRPGRPVGSRTNFSKHWIPYLMKQIDAPRRFKEIIEGEDKRLAVDVMRYLLDHVWGKPSQPLSGDSKNPIATDAKVEIVFHYPKDEG